MPDPDTVGADPATFSLTLFVLMTTPAGSGGSTLTFKVSVAIPLPPNTLTASKDAATPCVKDKVGSKAVATTGGAVGGEARPGNLLPITPK